jgi:RNA polymerase sigma factor (sigma-70 family)
VTAYEDRAAELFAVAYRVAYRLTGLRADAEDIAQETSARAYLRWTRISPYADAWAARSAANLALDTLRRRARSRPATSTGSSTGDPDRVDLVRALRQLPRRQRDVIVLRYIADLPEQAVADRLGCSLGAVKQHAHRALAALRADTHLHLAEGPLQDV